MKATVERVHPRGFAFARAGDEIIFVHASKFDDDDFDQLRPGDEIEVDVHHGDPRGPSASRAARVTPLPTGSYVRWDSPLDGWDRNRGRDAKDGE